MSNKIPTYWFQFLHQFYEKVKLNPIFQNIKKDTNKKCVLIEPRKHPLLKFVVYNFMYHLAPKGWGLHIVCGTDNHSFVKDALKDITQFTTQVLPFDNLTEPLYNQLLTNPGFYESIISCSDSDLAHILIFQTDTILLRDNVDEYLQYDYIGAAWQHTLHYSQQFGGKAIGMNGGLSLRNVNTMIKLLRERRMQVLENEDGWISFKNFDMLNLPSLQTACEFSVETVWSDQVEIPTGFHATYKFQSEEKIKKCLSTVLNLI